MDSPFNPETGIGVVVLKPLKEKKNIEVTVKATNPRDLVRTPITRTQIVNSFYKSLSITPAFDFSAGAFSRYDAASNTLYLGDGEEGLFHLLLGQDNASLSNIALSWIPSGTSTEDNRLSGSNNGKLTLTKETAVTDNGQPLYKIKHGEDYQRLDSFLISKDLSFEVSNTPSGLNGESTAIEGRRPLPALTGRVFSVVSDTDGGEIAGA